jgi:hypothetical protein
VSETPHAQDERHPHAYTHQTYDRAR